VYYSTTASSLNKRPLGDIYSEKTKKKGGERSAANNPRLKKNFKNVGPRVSTGNVMKVSST